MISKEKLIKDIRVYADLKGANGEVELANGVLKTLSIIKEQPTAYDVDNVVEEIEEYKNDMKNEWEYYSTTHNGMLAEYYRGRYNSAVYLLEKVKECGRDDK